MSTTILLRRRINKVYKSVAFIPALVVVFFLLLAVFMIYLDYSPTGKHIKAASNWIRLKDPATARSVISVITTGLISLTVFSFSMVMVVLNQAASQLSNRVLDKLVGNHFHQFIIGFYVGDIIFSLLLLTSIRDIEAGIYVPALSTYLLIFLSVIAIFLFVLFLHFITQTIKYTTIIRHVYQQTLAVMKKTCTLKSEADIIPAQSGYPICAVRHGIFEAFERSQLVRLAARHSVVITFHYSAGQYVLENTVIASISPTRQEVSYDGLILQIHSHISLVDQTSIDSHFYSGFKQLSEIAIKALSPGINDPGTAAESLQALFALLAFRRRHHPDNNIRDADGTVRIITSELSFDDLVDRYLLPVWDYGKTDRTICHKIKDLLPQLQSIGNSVALKKLSIAVNSSFAFHTESMM